ncbi:transcription antitermination factor NusB [Roseivirga sp. BDSF3-8]|uniref:transcription antitermination factor NusB n=1 Tax=Roseivirga sp. BDSF3-8 TaxID=3241598 RepID=UPI0035319561
MLNRRSLRIKAMQAIYSFKQSEASNFELAKELIDDTFAPDLNSMIIQDKAKLREKATRAKQIFSKNFSSESVDFDSEQDDEIRKAVTNSINWYRNQVRKDREFHKKNMVAETEAIYDIYLLLLSLIPALAEQAHKLEEGKKSRHLQSSRATAAANLNLYHNKVVNALEEDPALKQLLIKNNIGWAENRDEVRVWYKEILLKDEKYREYIKQDHPSLEEDKKIVNHIVKNLVFKSEPISKFMEEQDLSWEEDRAALKSMVVKTIKSAEPGKDAEEGNRLILINLSNNWEDDKEFYKDLYSLTLSNEREYEETIAAKAKNWDIDRMAATDQIILKMGLCEMLQFHSIPVKVTINEYIEISKMYSTPKSKQFINGILDVLAQELSDSGAIRKSGRGLIDNK